MALLTHLCPDFGERGGSRTNFPCHHRLEEEGERKARTGGGFSAISGAVTAHVASEETHSVPSKSKVVSTFSRPSCCLQGRCSEETFTHCAEGYPSFCVAPLLLSHWYTFRFGLNTLTFALFTCYPLPRSLPLRSSYPLPTGLPAAFTHSSARSLTEM